MVLLNFGTFPMPLSHLAFPSWSASASSPRGMRGGWRAAWASAETGPLRPGLPHAQPAAGPLSRILKQQREGMPLLVSKQWYPLIGQMGCL